VIAVPAGMRVLVATKPVDFCRGADSLAALVREQLRHDYCRHSVRSGDHAGFLLGPSATQVLRHRQGRLRSDRQRSSRTHRGALCDREDDPGLSKLLDETREDSVGCHSSRLLKNRTTFSVRFQFVHFGIRLCSR
jgi:hypothetical protein